MWVYKCHSKSAGSENNFHKLVLEIELTDIRLSGKCLYLMSHFPEPFFKFSYTKISKVRHVYASARKVKTEVQSYPGQYSKTLSQNK